LEISVDNLDKITKILKEWIDEKKIGKYNELNV